MDAEEPKPRRRRNRRLPGSLADPIAEAMQAETVSIAEDLSAALSALGPMTDSGVKVICYRIPVKGGEWEHVKQLSPPFDVSELINELEQNYGPGKYAVRIVADGKIRTTKQISIAAPKGGSVLNMGGTGLGQPDLLKLLLDRKPDDSNKDMFMFMMNMQQANAQANTTMMMESNKLMITLMTSLMGNRPDPGEQFARMAVLMKDLRAPENGLKETMELIGLAKELTGDGGSGGFLDMAKSALPMLATMAQTAGQAPGAPSAPLQAALPAPAASAHRAAPPPIHGADGAMPAANDPPQAGDERHPVLSVVQPEIEFFMRRGHDPELAADAIADVLRAHQITREALFAFGLEIQGSDGNFVERLRGLGLDVSQHVEWFTTVLGHLAEIDWTADDDDGGAEDHESADGGERPGGGGTDLKPDAGASAGRGRANPRPKQGGAAN